MKDNTTIKEYLIKILISMGMFESQAIKVMEIAIPKIHKLTDHYRINFDDDSETYPRPIYNVLMLGIKPIALEWINENAPEAWYKPMFEPITKD